MSHGNGRGRPGGSDLETPAKKSEVNIPPVTETCTDDPPDVEPSGWKRGRMAEQLRRRRKAQREAHRLIAGRDLLPDLDRTYPRAALREERSP